MEDVSILTLIIIQVIIMEVTKLRSYEHITMPGRMVQYNEKHDYQSNIKYFKDGVYVAMIIKEEVIWKDATAVAGK